MAKLFPNSFLRDMRRLLFITTALFISTSIAAQSSALKQQTIGFIEKNKNAITAWSDSIWTYAEPSFGEHRSVKLLTGILKANGFTVQENVCGSPFLFIASYGTAKPVIGLFGEYDADPNSSNKVVPRKEELVPGGYGHGGGHNLLGVGSLATALAIKELISQRKLNATIRYYGSTSEGTQGTRAWLARDGYFDDLDFSLYWHPSPVTRPSTSTWDAMIDMEGSMTAANQLQTAAAVFMEQLEKLKLSNSALGSFDFHFKNWKNDGDPVPDTIAFTLFMQFAFQEDANSRLNRIRNVADSLKKNAGVNISIKVKRAMHQFLPNVTASKIIQANMEQLGPIQYNREDIDFSMAMLKHIGSETHTIRDTVMSFSESPRRISRYGYASDIGEASWIAPEVYFVVKSLPYGISMHSWQNAAFTAHSIGHKGMLHAAKLMSMTIIDYVLNKKLQDDIRAEFHQKTADYKYKPIIEK